MKKINMNKMKNVVTTIPIGSRPKNYVYHQINLNVARIGNHNKNNATKNIYLQNH